MRNPILICIFPAYIPSFSFRIYIKSNQDQQRGNTNMTKRMQYMKRECLTIGIYFMSLNSCWSCPAIRFCTYSYVYYNKSMIRICSNNFIYNLYISKQSYNSVYFIRKCLALQLHRHRSSTA